MGKSQVFCTIIKFRFFTICAFIKDQLEATFMDMSEP